MYFDEVNGDPLILTNPIDQQVVASIYRKRDRQFMQSVTLSKTTTSSVKYTNPNCTINKLSTLVLIFTGNLYLSEEYSDPLGYYIVWERCCRNEIIDNIYFPEGTGQAFYLEFPPIMQNGKVFINSSPSLFPPLSDYACVKRPFYYDFSGTDLDGDSLTYAMVAPYAGNSSAWMPLPPPSPGPYAEVSWISGINEGNMIPGNPSIKINSQTGLLFVTPSKTGLFVFGVKCEEYRNGKKIGEVRRDFQLLVVDCPVNDPPKITVTNAKNQIFDANKISLEVPYGEDNCYHFQIKDLQFPSILTADIRAINFDNALLKQTNYKQQITSENDALTFEICLPDCPNENFEPYLVEVIAKDNGCSLPLLDTTILEITIKLPDHIPATITTSLVNDELTNIVGNTINFDVTGNDPKGTAIKVTAVPIDFSFEDLNIQFEEKTGSGQVTVPFSWNTSCNFLNLNEKDVYEIDFILEELQPCPGLFYDTVRVKIKLIADPNQPPLLSINRPISDPVIVYVGQEISWNVEASDPDNYFISLSAQPRNFDLTKVGAFFENKEGNSSVTSPFTWTITCDYLNDTIYEIDFIAFDKNCYDPEYDTLKIRIEVRDQPHGHEKFLPPNVFTPNGDGINEAFTLENLIENPESLTAFSLPKDMCGNVFEEVVIVNRWGSVVFKDNKRDFAWTAKGLAAGTYFYSIKYSRILYKGSVSVLY